MRPSLSRRRSYSRCLSECSSTHSANPLGLLIVTPTSASFALLLIREQKTRIINWLFDLKLAVAAPFFVQTHTHAARPADAAATCASRLRTSRSTRANQHTTFPARRPTTTPGRPRRQRVRCRPLTARGPRRGTDDVVQAPASAVGRAQTPGEYHPTHHQPCHPPTGTPHTHPTAQPHHSPAIPRHTRTRKEGAQNTGAHHPAGCS